MEKGKTTSGAMKNVGGKIDSPCAQGDKGIPSGIKSNGGPGGKVENMSERGDKGIPPMNANPSSSAPKD